jgi:hypothetical protein
MRGGRNVALIDVVVVVAVCSAFVVVLAVVAVHAARDQRQLDKTIDRRSGRCVVAAGTEREAAGRW